MSEANRITAKEIKAGVEDKSFLLVCAYDDDAKFDKFHLEGAIPLSAFKEQVGGLDKSQKLVFYCA